MHGESVFIFTPVWNVVVVFLFSISILEGFFDHLDKSPCSSINLQLCIFNMSVCYVQDK